MCFPKKWLLCLAMLLMTVPALAQSELSLNLNDTKAPAAAFGSAEVQPEAPIAVQEAGDDKFHRTVIQTAVKMVREKKMPRAHLIRIRVAMLSPAFREKAADLAVIQLSANGADDLPITETGGIDRAAIDWDALIEFIERLIPLIMQLIDLFGGLGGGV